MLKILIVSGTFPPRKYGGVTKITYLVAKKLAERGHEVTVFTTDVGNNEYERLSVRRLEIINGIHVYYFRNLSNIIAFRQRILLPLGMISAFARDIHNFDIVHLNGLRNFHEVVMPYFAKKYNVPYVQQAHGSLSKIKPKRILKLFWDELFGHYLLRNASKVIALSRVEAKQYRSMGVPEEKIAIIPNGIYLSEYAKLPPRGSFKKKFNIREDKKIILYLGRIHKTKGIDFLVRAYAYLAKKMNFKDVFLVIAGPDEGYLKEVKELTATLGISKNVLFTGLLSEKDKIAAYVDANIVANVEPINVYGLVPLEAAACETPVIVSKGNAIKDIIHEGKFGFSVKCEPINLAPQQSKPS